ncbi:hypothetical protein ABVB69_01945 [Streptomyces sp. NPDC000349]|uniref:hypothetical protein n=1 Tax=unclassified Streptomyces TaxID=2593676 RepID=UPI00278B3780|nr:hypothetical protein [Streptomyces sp. DSM 40167]MDQ0403792.1 hypothetical protein [Streptomyces sp. DSM 40167]
MAAEKHPDGHSDGHAGHDALMAAITGEPLPPGAGAEAHGAYRSATADVALLREQLGVIGRSLSGPPAEPVPGPLPEPGISTVVPAPRRPRRRPLTLALGALAVVCAGTVVTGLGWLVAQGGSGGSDDASGKGVASDERADSSGSGTAFGSPHYLACARLVAEGTVTRAEPVPGTGRHRVTLDVTRTYKPEPGGRPEQDVEPVTFELDDGTARLAAGDRALIGIPLHGDTPDAVITGGPAIAAERAWITASLAESRTLTCD